MTKMFSLFLENEENYRKFCEEAKKDNYTSLKPLPKTECPYCKHILFPVVMSGLQKERLEKVEQRREV